MQDVAKYFSTVDLPLLGLLVAALLGLLRHFFLRLEKKVDDISKSMGSAVTRDECEHRHADMLGFIRAIVGITNCKTCNGKHGSDDGKV